MEPRKILLIGCGTRRTLDFDATPHRPYVLTTVDIIDSHKPDVVWDLDVAPWPLEDNCYDEVHGYEILEHLGQQGHAYSFFETFAEIYRVLKPGGMMVGSCPSWDGKWGWGDPSHKRIINDGTLVFLDQNEYKRQVGHTAMTDFRSIWHGDFEGIEFMYGNGQFFFRLRAIKPSRIQIG